MTTPISRHTLRSHYDGKVYGCSCGSVYRSNRVLWSHKQTHKEMISCSVCQKQFTTTKNFMFHWKAHHFKTHGRHHMMKSKFLMLQPFGNWYFFLFLWTVRVVNKIGPFICDKCGSKYERRPFLIFHLKSHQGIIGMLCDLCPQIFNQKGALVKHMEKAHMEPRFACQICEYKNCHEKNLKTHMLRHGPKVKCKVCHRFSTNLGRHMRSRHPKAKWAVGTKNKNGSRSIVSQPRKTNRREKASLKWSLKWIPKISAWNWSLDQ